MIIAAFADCHIGNYGTKLDPETGLNARLIDCVASLRFVREDANARGAGLILFAGDMFRSPTAKPTPTELVLASDALLGDLPVIGIPGNHDVPRSIGEVTGLAPLSDPVLDERSRPEVETRDQGGVEIQFGYLPWPNRSALAASLPDYHKLSPADADRLVVAHLESILRGLAAELDPSMPSILLAHISIDSAEVGAERQIMAGKDITIPLSAVPQEFTFAVLGHVHKPQDFAAQGRPNVFYCGSTERIDFGEEGEDKSYVLLDTDAGTWERVPIPCREYATIDVCYEDSEFRCGHDLQGLDGAICRVRIRRPETARPDYQRIQGWVEQAGCWSFGGFLEDVERTTSVRNQEIVRAESLADMLSLWHRSKVPDVALDDLAPAALELERRIGA